MNTFEKFLGELTGRDCVFNPSQNALFINFIFANINAFEFGRQVKKQFGIDAAQTIELRSRINSSGYILQSVKPFLFYCWKNRLYGKQHRIQQRKEFGVNKYDSRLIRMMKQPVIGQYMHKLKKYAALTKTKLIRIMDTMPDKLLPYLYKQTHRKLRFIYQNQFNGVTFTDLVGDCMYKGIQSIYQKYPRIDSTLHALNVAKASSKNACMNIISTFTSASRAVIYKDDKTGGFQSRVQSILNDSGDYNETVISQQLRSKDAITAVEDSMNVYFLLKNFEGLKRRAVTALLGLPEPKFTRWLQKNASVRDRMSNEQLLEKLIERPRGFDRYEDYLCQFLKIKDYQLDRFKRQLQELV